VEDGVNGYRISVGDIQGFAERLETLQQDINLRRQMSLNAYTTVDKGSYRIQDMVDSYLEVFQRVLTEAESGAFSRPDGEILPPPFLQPLWINYLPPLALEVFKYGKRAVNQLAFKPTKK